MKQSSPDIRINEQDLVALRRRWLVGQTGLFLLIFLGLTIWVMRPEPLWIDLATTRLLQAINLPGFDLLMLGVSVWGGFPWNMILILLIGTIVAWQLSFKAGLYLALICSIQGLLNTLLKTTIARPRPDVSLIWVFKQENGYSFPSGHVMFYTVFFGFLVFLAVNYLSRSRLRMTTVILCGLMIVLVGLSRIYLGAHWLTDVVAAYLLGAILLGWAVEAFLSYEIIFTYE
jgi:undecaprenyl-diphosphatase